jgi:tetratricopeptide (TPR) repeat protein/transcriptional regulator with XRE-family HTH domain
VGVFGDVVRRHRRRLGLSQEDLADLAGINPKTIRSIEAGRRTPRPSTVRQLADAFGLTSTDREVFCAAALTELPGVAAQVTHPSVIPAQLPPDVPCFTGRYDELERLDQLLADLDRASFTGAIGAISGTAGVGKTALALHWAHQVADRFPDGQLYVNLRGFDHAGQIMVPATAVRVLLDALGVAAEQIPPDLDAQIGLYRSLVAGKRILVLLDNARDSEQVRALLPGAPSTCVLVTSRDDLTPLVVTNAAQLVGLDLMPFGDAHELLARRLGRSRVTAEPEAVDTIVTACAGLPLALAIAAARTQQTGFPLATVAAELGSAGHRLDALDAGDPTSQIRAVFSWSYRALSPPASRLFQLFGLHPGPDLPTAAAASLAGIAEDDARRLLAELTRAHLLTEHRPGRYTGHDLLRTYAAELTAHRDPPADRQASLDRLLSHYMHTAHAADRILNPHRDPLSIPLDPLAVGAHIEAVPDADRATAWLAAEYPVLTAILEHVADSGLDRHACQLAWLLDTYLDRCGHWYLLTSVWRTALAAAERLDHLPMQAYAYRRLGYIETRLDRHVEAETALRRGLDLYTDVGDPAGRANVHHALAYLRRRQGDQRAALDHARQAYACFQAAGHERGQAITLNAIGWYLSMLGQHDEALDCCQRALALLQRVGDPYGQAHAWDNLGSAYHRTGDHGAATDCHRHAIALFRQLGERYYEAATLNRLGDVHVAAGDPDAARTAWRQAWTLLTDLGHADADAVKAKLHDIEEPAESTLDGLGGA